MKYRKLIYQLLVVTLSCLFVACDGNQSELEKRLKILPNDFLSVASKPILHAHDLHNPTSPLLVDDMIVYSESGSGEIRQVPFAGGEATSIITGFGSDTFAGYQISVQGITIDQHTGTWIVSAAEGDGHVYLFDPEFFPTDIKSAREISIEDATEDNPYETVLAVDGSILVASGGTSKAYMTELIVTNPAPLRPILEVETGIIGLAVDPNSGDVFGAVFGSSQNDGSIIRWNPAQDKPTIQTIATGFNNLVDVTFTPDGILLALEFGSLEAGGEGSISIVATDGRSEIVPFIEGLLSPSSLYVSPERILFITEFGASINGQAGNLISLELASPATTE